MFLGAGAAALLAVPGTALATQGHGGPEGLYVHQLSHVFFCISMGILIYWLRARKLTHETGWRYIGWSASLFILWTADAFTVHLLDEQLRVVRMERVDLWRVHVEAGPGREWLISLYYFAKLDHLFCVPALAFLYLGLRRLLAAPEPPEGRETAP